MASSYCQLTIHHFICTAVYHPSFSERWGDCMLGAMTIRQALRFVTSRDGTRIAVAAIGQGPPLLRTAHWLSHVQYDTESPVWRPWLRALSARHSYIRYDQRGCGLSDRNPTDISFAAWRDDLDAVAATIEAPRFPILGMSQGGALAIDFALRHPERVSKLILLGAYGRGGLKRARTEREQAEARLLIDMIRLGWGRDNPAFRQVFTHMFIPGGTAEQHRWWSDLERITSTAEIAARTLEELFEIDVSDGAASLRLPVLVMHSRGDARIPFEEGRRLASLIPDARFVPLDSDNHVLLPTEPSWGRFVAELDDFLSEPDANLPCAAAVSAHLSPAETAVFALLAEGLDNRTISERLGKSEKTVRNQVTAILDKLGVHSRAEAIVRAIKP